jgi:hypothetical protein
LLNHGDHRIHRIPFTTSRPTMKEAKWICHLLGNIHYVNESCTALGTKACVNIDGAAAVGIWVPSNESNVLLESEKTGRSIKVKPPKGKLNWCYIISWCCSSDICTSSSRWRSCNIYDSSACGSEGWKQWQSVGTLIETSRSLHMRKRGKNSLCCCNGQRAHNGLCCFVASHPNMWDWHTAAKHFVCKRDPSSSCHRDFVWKIDHTTLPAGRHSLRDAVFSVWLTFR